MSNVEGPIPFPIPEWEEERASFERIFNNEIIQTLLAKLARPAPAGHAYTSKELAQLRSCLGVPVARCSDEILHIHTDVLAAMVQAYLTLSPNRSSRDRITTLQQQIARPAEQLIAALKDRTFIPELTGPFRRVDNIELDRDNILKILDDLKQWAALQADHIQKTAVKGRTQKAAIKERFVELVRKLCEFIEPNFRPTRVVSMGCEQDKGLAGPVAILAIPIFGPSERFTGSIRKHVDNENELGRWLSEHYPDDMGE